MLAAFYSQKNLNKQNFQISGQVRRFEKVGPLRFYHYDYIIVVEQMVVPDDWRMGYVFRSQKFWHLTILSASKT